MLKVDEEQSQWGMMVEESHRNGGAGLWQATTRMRERTIEGNKREGHYCKK